MLLLALLIILLYLVGGFTIHFLLILAVILTLVWLFGAFAPGYRGHGWYGRPGRWW